jgi:transcriptional regulator with XRE-family HTH domain
MVEPGTDLNGRIAARVAELRAERGLSLEMLANKSGVSRSMISLVERAETSPTAVTLAKLSSALGVPLSSLFDPGRLTTREAGPLARREQQVAWRDPGSGYVRRNVTPPGVTHPMRVSDVTFPAGARVAFENEGSARVYQQIWMLAGAMDVTVGAERHRLREGDCLAMELDAPAMFHNPTRKAARYAVVVAAGGGVRR